jgi:hypothetical protein
MLLLLLLLLLPLPLLLLLLLVVVVLFRTILKAGVAGSWPPGAAPAVATGAVLLPPASAEGSTYLRPNGARGEGLRSGLGPRDPGLSKAPTAAARAVRGGATAGEVASSEGREASVESLERRRRASSSWASAGAGGEGVCPADRSLAAEPVELLRELLLYGRVRARPLLPGLNVAAPLPLSPEESTEPTDTTVSTLRRSSRPGGAINSLIIDGVGLSALSKYIRPVALSPNQWRP